MSPTDRLCSLTALAGHGDSLPRADEKNRLRRAYGGLGEILAVVTPLMWGHLFSISQQPPAWLPRLLRWGKAGHCALAAVLYVLCWRALHHADDSTLFIDDDDDDDEGEQEEEEEE